MGIAESSGIYARGAEFYGRTAVAEAYGARPGYPPEAIQFVLDTMVQHEYTGNSPLRILDAGSGPGQLTEALIDRFSGAEIFAIDQSAAMILAMPAHIKSNVTAVVGSFDDTRFPDDYFDLITFGTAIHWGDHNRLPRELWRLLCPGGFVASISNITRIGTPFTAVLDGLPNQAATVNPITVDTERIALGEDFTFVGFDTFTNDVRRTHTDFNRLLASIEILSADPDSLDAANALRKMQLYANDKDNIEDGLIKVPFDTYVRMARAKVTRTGAIACRSMLEP